MKKIFMLLPVLVLSSIASMNAESDIQISMPLISLCDIYSASWNDRTETQTYEKNKFYSIVSNFDIIKIKNTNFPKTQKFGFYESIGIGSVSVINNYSPFIITFSLGGAFKIYETETSLLLADAGLHLKAGESDYIWLGAEADFQYKLTKHRRCSPIFGFIVNFDFYSNEEKEERNTTKYPYQTEKYKLDSYFHFYIQPYIALGINF